MHPTRWHYHPCSNSPLIISARLRPIRCWRAHMVAQMQVVVREQLCPRNKIDPISEFTGFTALNHLSFIVSRATPHSHLAYTSYPTSVNVVFVHTPTQHHCLIIWDIWIYPFFFHALPNGIQTHPLTAVMTRAHKHRILMLTQVGF